MQAQPQDRVARDFVEERGYRDATPVDVSQVEGETCWYYYYELPDGDLELEVSWSKDEGWSVVPTGFRSIV